MGSILKTAFLKIDYFYPFTRVIIVSIAFIFATNLIPEFLANFVSISFIVTVGLMHGATDHILYINSENATFKSKIPKSFLIKYLFILGIMGLFWLLIPKFALSVFLVISAYHFGQTQLQYIPISEGSLLKKLLYLTWGLLVISIVTLLNTNESISLINSAVPEFDLNWLSSELPIVIILILSIVFLVFYLALCKPLSWHSVFFEMVELIALALLASQTNLIITFGFFFGLWHSLRASQVQIDKINKVQKYELKTFLIESLPFTIISIFGIAFMILIAKYFEANIRLEMLFLVAISMLTLPHMFIYERFYNYFDKKKF